MEFFDGFLVSLESIGCLTLKVWYFIEFKFWEIFYFSKIWTKRNTWDHVAYVTLIYDVSGADFRSPEVDQI